MRNQQKVRVLLFFTQPAVYVDCSRQLAEHNARVNTLTR